MYCEVYILDAPYHIDRPFDYECAGSVKRGNLVKVPFGRVNHLRVAVVTEVKDTSDSIGEIKAVHSVIGDKYTLSDEMLSVAFFMKEYTLCTFGEAVRCILPPGALSDTENVKLRKICELTLNKTEAKELLCAKGRAGIRSGGQRAIVRFLLDKGSSDLQLIRDLPGVGAPHVKALSDRGIIKISSFEEIRNPYSAYTKVRDTSPIILAPSQMKAYDVIEGLYTEDGAKAALLYGVTGSGKTKVIMRLIDRVIQDKKTVIMLVPEISLTPQTVNLFCRRYGDGVAVIHSSLSKGERLDAWRKIRRGEVNLVIGTRSAIFAPLDNIGLIVIDEEHEHTYKSESDPKYHARDIAAYRCSHHAALMLLASATPSLESFYKAKCGIYTLVPLRERYGGAKLPKAYIVDMREELRLGNTSPISDRLLKSLGEVYQNKNQAILFLNRRGYSPEISCKACGEVISCPRCSVSLTYHTNTAGGKMLCHLCGYTDRVPRACLSCGADKLSFLGFGTQKLEGELSKYAPDMRVMRMDADTTSGKLAYDRMLEDFREGNADVLLGTQMVAKGHDFPRVTLVGVALADTSLFISDFRASERTFSLLTQVIGRAGRSKDSGIAVIQTFAPSNEVIKLACTQDYEKFYEGEIAIRRELSYPPFCDMVAMTITADDEDKVKTRSEELSKMLIKKLENEYASLPFVVFGPFEAQVYRLNEKYRMRMVVKCKLTKKSRALFHELLCSFSSVRDATLAIDLNPLTV